MLELRVHVWVVLIYTTLVWFVLALSVGPRNGHLWHHYPRYGLNIETDTTLCWWSGRSIVLKREIYCSPSCLHLGLVTLFVGAFLHSKLSRCVYESNRQFCHGSRTAWSCLAWRKNEIRACLKIRMISPSLWFPMVVHCSVVEALSINGAMEESFSFC